MLYTCLCISYINYRFVIRLAMKKDCFSENDDAAPFQFAGICILDCWTRAFAVMMRWLGDEYELKMYWNSSNCKCCKIANLSIQDLNIQECKIRFVGHRFYMRSIYQFSVFSILRFAKSAVMIFCKRKKEVSLFTT